MSEEQQEKKQSLFRKKAMDRISSPEQLDQYLHVTGPGVWLPLITVVILLIGSLVWMTVGSIDITINVAVQSFADGVVCYVPADQKAAALERGEVDIAGKPYPLTDTGLAVLLVDEGMNADLRRAGELAGGTVVAPLVVEADMMQGIYQGVLTVQAVHPISYIIN